MIWELQGPGRFAVPLLIIVVLVLAVWLYILVPSRMARNRDRSPLAWILIAVVLSPIAAILLLWGIGKSR